MTEASGVDASCPECGESISGHEGTCPACGLSFLDDDGGLSQDALDAMLDDAGIDPPGPRGSGGYYTPQWVRLVIGLAIAVPMAPLTLFVAESIAPLSLWLSATVFGFGWLLSGYALSRRAVPSVIVATGLLLVGFTLAVTPLVIVAGRTLLGTEADEIGALGSNVFAAQTAFLAVGLVVVALGTVVYRQATAKRKSWAEQATHEHE